MESSKKKTSLLVALVPPIFLISALGVNAIYLETEIISGSGQIMILMAGVLAAILGVRGGSKWGELLDGVVRGTGSVMVAIWVLLIIGSLAGSWMVSGVVPAMMYYGFSIMRPDYFLVSSFLLCSVVSLTTGSSWMTIGTLGVALIGMGKVYGVGEGITAGAIISGAYFGDKLSPFSDTTNLASSLSGVNIFRHIRYMVITSVPTFALVAVGFLGLGFFQDSLVPTDDIEVIREILASRFFMSPWLLLVPLSVVYLIYKKVHVLPALLLATMVGMVIACLLQTHLLVEAGGRESGASMWVGALRTLHGAVAFETGHDTVNSLLSTGGMAGMLNTVWLIFTAVAFGGIMEAAGFLDRISAAIIPYGRSPASSTAIVSGGSIFLNATASDQYLTLIIGGRIYGDAVKAAGLAPENLSRSLEDSGTVTSVLVPWNSCAAYCSGVLGVSTAVYFPYCFFNLLSPIMSIVFARFGIKIRRLP